ncbi:MAG TPA: class I SAM-dependent methyltransferase, partial [Planctomycetaceae bacterium]|nr:class I SAM-dependent methyltransferase [Planctomycetaceae bacterium]
MTTAESNMPLTASRAHNESPPQTVSPSDELKNAQSRYLAGEPRGRVFRDLVVNSIAQSRRNSRPSILDIGCGHGFMGDTSLQHSIISQGAHAVGIEPDAEIEVSQVFTEVHRTTFELAPLASGSIDVAYATFVLEHVSDPARFWGKLYECLAPGGVFWGFTVDARHPFCFASQTMQ